MSDRETANAKNAGDAVTALRQLAREEISRGGVADRVLVEAVAGNAIKVRALGSAVPGAQLIPISGFVPAVGSEVLVVRSFGGQLVALPLTSLTLGTGTGEVPTTDQVQQKLFVYDEGVLKLSNPSGIEFGARLSVTTQGNGFRLDVDPPPATIPAAIQTALDGKAALTHVHAGVGGTPAVLPGEFLGPLHYLGGAITSQSYTGNNFCLFRIVLDRPMTFDAFAIRLATAASGSIQMGLYASDAYGLATGTPLMTASGSLGGTAGTKILPVAAQTVAPGTYWIGFLSNATLTLQAIAEGALLTSIIGVTQATIDNTFFRQAGFFFGMAYGALPTNPGRMSALGSCAALYLRVA